MSEKPRRREAFDLAGAAPTVAASVSIVWGLIGAPDHGWTSVRTLGSLVTSRFTPRSVAQFGERPLLVAGRPAWSHASRG